MKKTTWLTFGLIMILTLALTLSACGKPADGNTDGNPDNDVATTQAAGDDTTASTESTTVMPTVITTKTNQSNENEIDWGDLFGDDTTTTTNTTKKGETTTTTKKTTTTTTKQTTVTTLKPTVVDEVTLPAVGTDVDGRGRIKVSEVVLEGSELTIVIRNVTGDTGHTGGKWITQETDYITYACYDANGKELKGKGEYFGTIYLGCLEVGERLTSTITLPKGTAEVRLTGASIVYWTPWS